MKIRNIENQEEVLYVQWKDLRFLDRLHLETPTSILSCLSALSLSFFYDEEAFMDFCDMEEIQFFESLDWIIDYSKMETFSEEEILSTREELSNRIESLSVSFLHLSPEEQKRNSGILEELEFLRYQLDAITEILDIRKGKKKLELDFLEGQAFLEGNPKEAMDSKEKKDFLRKILHL